MNSQTSGLRVAGAILALFAIGHLLRLLTQADVLVAGHQIPMWVSGLALFIAAGLSLWMFKLSSARNR